MLPLKAIHPNPRSDAAPSNNASVDRNPPSLLWPAARGKNARYSVRLSQNPQFPKKGTLAETGLPWAMYTPAAALESGTWYWQTGVSARGKLNWSSTHQFVVTASARQTHLPPAAFILDHAASIRPRLLPTRESLRKIRSAKSKDLAQELNAQTGHLLGQELPDDATPPSEGDDEYKLMKFARWKSKRLAANQALAVEDLLCAGHLNGDNRFADEAVRRARNVASWDPDGFTNPVISDFADASCMRAMALAYDTEYQHLSGQDRRHLREAMVVRCRRFYEASINDVEVRLFGGHLWQHLLTEFFEAALALVGDVPEARTWCRYIYELWVARFPLIGGSDGGWANGPKYFGTNVETLILMTDYFDRLGAHTFDQAPWFRNASKFLSYAWPPGSENDGFGDGTELENVPSATHVHWMDHLGHRFADQDAIDYAARWREFDPPDQIGARLSLLSLNWKPPSRKKPRTFPKAIRFQDTGLVSAHTSIENVDRNLTVAFRASPFGSFNHMHSCQNAFNVFFGGERLFANSGYYVAMVDEHAKSWYKDTRGHNTILIDGKSQKRGPEGYGWIPRFIDGDRISYWGGDASNAYGEAGLLRYRRHVSLLHPNVVVVYDDLVADHEAEWTWQLHAHRKLTYNKRQSVFRSQTSRAKATLTFTSSAKHRVQVGDTFDPPALNWGKKAYRGGSAPEVFPQRWHAQARTNPTASARFLSIISVGPKPLLVRPAPGGYRVGQWTIEAEMDAATPASMVIRRAKDTVVLAVDTPGIESGGKTYRTKDCSLLLEDGKAVRVRDQLPSAALAQMGKQR